MTSAPLTVAIFGDGQLANGIGRLLRTRASVQVLRQAGREDASSVLGSGADVVVICTTTLLRDVASSIEEAVEAGSNVIVSAEEAAYPWAVDPDCADRLDRLARTRGVSILGAGLNPGFLFDALVLTLLGVHASPTRIEVERVVDLSRFGPAVRARLGLGFEPAELEAGRAEGRILGHAGFVQSMHVVAQAIGTSIDAVEAEFVPIYTDRALDLPGYTVAAGTSAGFRQHYRAMTDGQLWYSATFTGHVRLDAIGLESQDRIVIADENGRSENSLLPGVQPQLGSVAVIANSLVRVKNAGPGWVTVADLPPAIPHPHDPSEAEMTRKSE